MGSATGSEGPFIVSRQVYAVKRKLNVRLKVGKREYFTKIAIHLSQNCGSAFSAIWWKKSRWEPAQLIRRESLAAITYYLSAETYESLA